MQNLVFNVVFRIFFIFSSVFLLESCLMSEDTADNNNNNSGDNGGGEDNEDPQLGPDTECAETGVTCTYSFEKMEFVDSQGGHTVLTPVAFSLAENFQNFTDSVDRNKVLFTTKTDKGYYFHLLEDGTVITPVKLYATNSNFEASSSDADMATYDHYANAGSGEFIFFILVKDENDNVINKGIGKANGKNTSYFAGTRYNQLRSTKHKSAEEESYIEYVIESTPTVSGNTAINIAFDDSEDYSPYGVSPYLEKGNGLTKITYTRHMESTNAAVVAKDDEEKYSYIGISSDGSTHGYYTGDEAIAFLKGLHNFSAVEDKRYL